MHPPKVAEQNKAAGMAGGRNGPWWQVFHLQAGRQVGHLQSCSAGSLGAGPNSAGVGQKLCGGRYVVSVQVPGAGRRIKVGQVRETWENLHPGRPPYNLRYRGRWGGFRLPLAGHQITGQCPHGLLIAGGNGFPQNLPGGRMVECL